MSATLRTLICSCQYLHEADPRAALCLTRPCMCSTTHCFALPMWKPWKLLGSKWGRGREGRPVGKAGEELCVYTPGWILYNCRGFVLETSDLGLGTSFGRQGAREQACQNQALGKEGGSCMWTKQASSLTLASRVMATSPGKPSLSWQGMCVRMFTFEDSKEQRKPCNW